MRKHLIRLGLPSLLSLIVVTSANAQSGAYYNAVEGFNPVLYFPLTESVAPPATKPAGVNLGTLGATDNGTYTDGAFPGVPGAMTGDTGGLFSGATGVSPRLFTPYDAAYASVTNFTVEIWVNSPTNDPAETCIVNCVDAASPRNGWLIYTDPSGPGTFNFRTFYGNGATTSVNYNMAVPGGHILANTWYHVVVSYTGATETAQGYIDGVALNSTNSNAGYTGSTAGPFCIGARNDASFAFPGFIDEVAFYPSVLSASDVANHYTAGSTGTASAYSALVTADNPALYFRMDEAAAPQAHNYGTAGAAANGYYETGTTPGQTGPALPGMGGASSLACAFNNGQSTDIGPSIPVVGAVGLSVGTATNDPMTLTAWVNAGTPSYFTTVLGKGDQAYRFDINNGSGVAHWNVGNNDEIVSVANVADATWHFWAGTWDGTNLVNLYIDGALAASATNNDKPNGNLQPFLMGTAPDDATRNFNGSLCQVAVFPSALSQAQVQQLYFSAGGLPPVLLASPQPIVAITGSNATYSVTAEGQLPLAYQWYSNGVAIANATNTSYTASNVPAASSGTQFTVTVTDPNKLATTSSPAGLAVIATPLPGSYFSSVVALNPLAYYPLNETIQPAPLTYATNIGTLGQSENAPYTDVSVYQSPGLLADTNPSDTNFSVTTTGGSIIEAPYTLALSNEPPFTVELWVQSGATSTEQCPVSDVDVGANRAGWLIYMDATAAGVYQFRAYNKNGANTSIALAANSTVNEGETHYLAVVVTTNVGGTFPNSSGIYPANSINAYFYMDGVLSATMTNGSFAMDDGGDGGSFAIGARSDNAFNFTGALSEVAYYTNALTPAVIASHYASGTSTTPAPPYYQLVQQSSPILFYQLDEIPNYPGENNEPVATNYGVNLANDNGFYLPGTAPGGTTGPSVGNFPGQGAANPAVVFNHFTESGNAVTGYVDVQTGGSDLNDRGPITMAAWIKAVPNDGRFQTFAGHSDSGYRMDVDTSMDVHFADANSAGDLTGSAVNDGKWHFVVGAWDGANEYLYIDGVQNGTQPATGVATGSSDDFTIGVDPQYEASRMFDGAVSELALFNYALSGPQVLSLFYSAGVAPIITNEPPAAQVIGNAASGTVVSGAYGTPNLTYMWLKNGAAISGAEFSGANTSALAINPASPGDGGSYSLVVSNNYGVVTSSVDVVVISQVPVIIPAVPASTHVLLGTTLSLSAGEIGSQPFTNAWYLNGVLLTDGGGVSGATTTNLVITDAGPADNGSYTFWATNSFGQAGSTGTVFVDSGLTFDDLAVGWGETNNAVSPGQGSVSAANVVTLTDGKGSEITSFFYATPMWIHAFKASWVYTDVGSTGGANATADGFTFCLQTTGTNMLQSGGGGSGLGYYQLTNSIALCAELYDNSDDAPGIDVATNGEGSAGVLASGFDYGATGLISIISGDPISFNVYYDGSNYNVSLTDLTTSDTYTTNYGVGPIWQSNILSSDTAYVGFTAATGGVSSTQTIADFYFTPILSLSVAINPGSVTLTWPTAVGGYVLQQSPDLLHWTTIPSPYTVVNNENQYTASTKTGTLFYRLAITP